MRSNKAKILYWNYGLAPDGNRNLSYKNVQIINSFVHIHLHWICLWVCFNTIMHMCVNILF